ncbi:hypoxanthine phosphoribosyltransferase [Fictibacillus barbaricus]|uniref:Hypoxanthine phosphoribosyltransferase n=1 Tax=Fictibacillus barbaricus TaxID=182136 RepID=A0ABS2ZKF3_9BACL|nr:hypoxanthine phosphoribosyltransferase [Fictibacillus barbaricus]MBN3547190.1 hypoxanthine phosphoribosyltransferase [Fictibacillus barbaricus]GGB47064.1 hypoxanthine phosphoribosyltransferase [Fictibacillus barbaricus]
MAYTLDSVLITEEELQQKVKEIGLQMREDFQDESIVLIVVLKGAFVFAADLIRELKRKVTVDFVVASSYGNQTETTGKVRLLKDIDINITDKHVVIVEDIIDSGLTLSFLREHFKLHQPKSMKICTLLDKPERRKVDLKADYVGFVIPDQFIVGYGIDYAESYRNLPYISTMKEE